MTPVLAGCDLADEPAADEDLDGADKGQYVPHCALRPFHGLDLVLRGLVCPGEGGEFPCSVRHHCSFTNRSRAQLLGGRLQRAGMCINTQELSPRNPHLQTFPHLCPPQLYSPITVTAMVRFRGRTSHSRRKICCHVPSSGAPFVTGMVTAWLSSVA